MKTTPGKLSVVSPSEYRTSVVGLLDESISDRLGGLTIENKELDKEGGKSMVTLTGWLADQAALFGVLIALNNMRIPLLAVEYICENE